ncbi:MAG: NADP-reducing hydrogenase subunit HndD [Moorella sp. (in: firmicutes)]|uniref:NADH-dependent [FeFe] hydrogenase, group A6 n=1 Tax=unclassified Neomoorella TaxID=2676739 RepID=UPI0010FFBABF|nr:MULTISPECIES: NADH-dependent [FeFe] hydrogenase, group A6 [unclassified Moorella (in: firmicutes)]MDK2816437.1 NADP-reducing hydrogenase subunit HndD [Moorella sp. (in: firmicutes)]GEA16146.1 ferredoxin [Moorella sp. E308F]GEA19009.1 ferredoxin [Moorella sp. E306M]
MSTVRLTIDNIPVEVEAGTTILKAAEKAGIHIPTLCYLEGINEIGACRVCVVEVEGARNLMASCVAPVADGMVVKTNSPRVRMARRLNVELLLSNHKMECPTCIRNLNCELQSLAQELGVRQIRFEGKKSEYPIDDSTPAIIREPDKCILCRRCVAVCEKVQGVKAIAPMGRGFDTVIAPAFQDKLLDIACVECGQCTLVCPVGALYEKDYTNEVWAALADPEKFVVVQTAPATRVSIGQEFGLPPGSINTGQMVAALRRLGFDRVFDTDFSADLTIMEEGSEFIERFTKGGPLPLITSCSPGWIKFMEHFYPEFIPNVSTCKSPQQMFGAVAKTFYAQKAGIDPAKMVVVSIMPCTAKKFECQRPEMRDSGYQDVDYVLTTRELARMIREAGIDFRNLPEEQYDDPLGESTGAAVIFGATGGVMEAALRTAYELITGKTLPSLDFYDVRGLKGIKEATVDIEGTKVRVAVAHSLGHARQLLERVKAGEQYHFIEIMCCPGGCIGGGGQPIPTNTEIREQRIKGIYQADVEMPIRKSHENPSIQALYREFLGKPLSEKSHHLLHTHYTPRGKY